MQIISKEDVQKAREMDLLTYLTYHEPGNLRHVSGTVYSTVEHDSLIINNGKWCWFSQGIGGRSALDYLIKVKGIPFREAVERIVGNVSAETLVTCYYMFYRGKEAELDLSTWNTSNVDNFSYAFYQVPNLSTLRLGPDFGFTPASGGSKPSNTCMFAGTADKTSGVGVKTASVPGYLNIYTDATQAEWIQSILTLRYLNGGYYDKVPVPVTFFDCDTGNPIEFTWPTYD